ncbi:MAG: hypothetical protein N2171_02380 [Clostridia bacterium]|nr:hypothetical protein [Clostridia bacterium]
MKKLYVIFVICAVIVVGGTIFLSSPLASSGYTKWEFQSFLEDSKPDQPYTEKQADTFVKTAVAGVVGMPLLMFLIGIILNFRTGEGKGVVNIGKTYNNKRTPTLANYTNVNNKQDYPSRE